MGFFEKRFPIGSATGSEHASTGTSCALPSAIDVARHRAQSSESIPEPPVASPGVRHPRNPSCVPVVRDWTAPVPDATFRTSAWHLLASRITASNIFPALPIRVSNIALSIPCPLPRPAARSAIRTAVADGPGCCQTYTVQSGTQHRLLHRTPPQLASSYEHRFPLFCRTLAFLLGRERGACCGYLNQARGLSPLLPGKNSDAQLFAQTRTLRIRQQHGFDFSIEFSTSPLQAVAMLTLSDFHEVSRAGRP